MGILIAIIGVLVFFFLNAFLGAIIFLVGLIIEIFSCLGIIGDKLNQTGITDKAIDWVNSKKTSDLVVIGVGIVVAVIIIGIILLEITENF